MTTYLGPCKMECPLKCSVPEGAEVTEVPPTRHGWADVLTCPNDDAYLEMRGLPGEHCGRTFLVARR